MTPVPMEPTILPHATHTIPVLMEQTTHQSAQLVQLDTRWSMVPAQTVVQTEPTIIQPVPPVPAEKPWSTIPA